MIDDFQNGLIYQLFSVFSSGFLHKTTLNHLENGFGLFFGILVFYPKRRNGLISRILSVFSSSFFA